jgi:signal transduction histidine kinase
MTMVRLKSLRARLVLWTMLINAVMLTLLSGLVWGVLWQSQNYQLNDTLQLSAAQLIAAVDVTNGRLSVPPSDAVAMRERGVWVWVLDTSSQVNATIGRAASLPAPAIDPGSIRDWQFAPGDSARLYCARLGENGGSVIVGISLQPLAQMAQTFALVLGISALLVLMLSAAGGLFLAGRALAPISAITIQAQRIHRDNLSERLALSGPHDEVHDLAQTFDEMLDRLQASFEAERRFTGDASHELRAPLSLLKAQLSLALSHPRDADTLTQMMTAMNDDVDRMTRLVQSLLALARTEAPLDICNPIDLKPLLNAVIQQLQSVAADRHIHLVLEGPAQPEVVVVGDPDQLARLFLNLLDNAIMYSTEGGSVRVLVAPAIDSRMDGWAIRIADSGIGISREHLAHLFDRFYRADASRARHTGGAGLGLSIAQAIAQQHGGHISVQSEPNRGSTFTVWLPAPRG